MAWVQAMAVTWGGTIIGMRMRKVRTALPRKFVNPTRKATTVPAKRENAADIVALSREFHKARGTDRLSSALRRGASDGVPSAVRPARNSCTSGASKSVPVNKTRAASVNRSPPQKYAVERRRS